MNDFDINKFKYYISNMVSINHVLETIGCDFIEYWRSMMPYELEKNVRHIEFNIADNSCFIEFKVVKRYGEEFMDWLDDYTDGSGYDDFSNEDYIFVHTSLYDVYSFAKRGEKSPYEVKL